jgi:toxin YoeB
MKLVWAPSAWDDYVHWQQEDQAVVARINELIKDARRSPFKGLGKPEPLKGDWSGWWSRRITREHRFIDRVSGERGDQRLEIAACRYHY